MKKKNYNPNTSIYEDKNIAGTVNLSVESFDENIMPILDAQFEKYVNGWPLKKAFFDSVEGGKRLRAFSTQLFYNLSGGKSHNGKKLAAAMELIHCASLVIDDELDKRNIRPDRNIPTIRGKYSPEEATMVMALDVLFATDLVFRATDEFADLKKSKIRDLFVKTVTDGGMGEILKWKFIKERKIPDKQIYWKKLVRSSGALFFQMSCEIGALTATDDDEVVDKMTLIGYKLGELLQAGDDLKDIKEDMRDGFYSLGVINYHDSLNNVEKKKFEKKLKEGFSERDLDLFYKEIIHSPSTQNTFKELKEKGNEISELLNTFSNSKEKQYLIKMITYLKDRMQII